MRHILRFEQLSLAIEPSRACWSLRHAGGAQAANLSTGLSYSIGGQKVYASPDIWQIEEEMAPNDPGQITAAWTAPGDLRVQLVFHLTGKEHPLLRWQMRITNHGREPAAIDSLELLNGGQDGQPWLTPGLEKPAFFSNGWQSWSFTGTYQAHETARRTRLGPLSSPMLSDPAAPRPKRPGHFVSDLFGVLGCKANRQGILAGFLSQQQQFGFVECLFDPLHFTSKQNTKGAALAPVLHLHAPGDGVLLAPGESLLSDWACLLFVAIDAERPLDPYLRAVAAEHDLDERGRRRSLPPDVSPPNNGWCSWYYYYQNITTQNLRENLKTAAALRPNLHLDLFQIDDGFETFVGDWFMFRPGFPNGVAPLAAEIREAGFIPGLWLAPFILQPSSHIAKLHPEWLLSNHRGRPVNAGFVWGGLSNALDLTHPEALAYAVETVRTAVYEWRFDFIKLDFLYAAALAGRHHQPGKTRAQILHQGLQALRDAAGDRTIILGCGCPLGPALGLVDVMRIGPDVDQRWEPSFEPINKISSGLNRALFNPETNMPSARNAIHNVLTRLPLHQRWWINDPDCLVLRDTSELTFSEVQALATAIFMSGGLFLLSDNLPALTPERLRIAQTMRPLLPEAARAEDWFESCPPQRVSVNLQGPSGPWRLLACFNWEETPAIRMLYPDLGQRPTAEPGLFFAHDYWSGETIPVNATTTITIPPHGVRLFAVRQVHPDRPAFLGSTLHMSQGLEVGQWQSPSEPGNTHKITLQTAAPLIGMATFYLPRQTDKDRWRIAAIATPDQLTYLPFEASPNHTVQVEITCNQQVEIILQETIRPNSQPGA